MAWKFETLGNAIVQFFNGDEPVLITDPWLVGTAYFGSWGIERPLSSRQLENAKRSRYVWISHGHPDHLHPESLELLDKQHCQILLADNYNPEIETFLSGSGFKTRVLRFKEWTSLGDGLRVMCLQNENMDAILAVEADNVLVLNKNDSPLCGEDRFFRNLMRGYERTFLLALCAVDADMINIYDKEMRPLVGSSEERKPGAIWATSKLCDFLGVNYFCCSSSQHVYLRADSIWANPYRIGWKDMEQYWCAKSTKLVPPYVTVNLDDCSIVVNEIETDASLPVAAPGTADDDWDEPLSETDWTKLEAFIRKFENLKRRLDFIGFAVAGEKRYFPLHSRAQAIPDSRERGLTFHVPRRSLMDVVAYGYFDDLLIGNFMKTQLHNAALYPNFSPIIAKLGGNAKVFTAAELLRFRWHFFRLSPLAFVTMRWQHFAKFGLMPFARQTATRFGFFPLAKAFYRLLVGNPKARKVDLDADDASV